MDFANASAEPWDLQYDEAWLEKDARLDSPLCIWDEDSMHLFDAATPIKNCTDMDYSVSTGHYGENMKKGSKDCREYSQLKRRRMLQFDSQENDPFICDEQIPSAFVKSKEGNDSLMDEGGDFNFLDTLHEDFQLLSRFSEDGCTSGGEVLDQSSDSWLENCLNDSEMQINTDDVNYSGVNEDQIDVSAFCTIPPGMEREAMQGSVPPTPRCIFTGNKSVIRTPTKLAAPVAYPFALIKPCGVQGDVTLKDINQRILTPSKSKHTKDDDRSSSYPTSAFSGKPVVVKTKIRTEGGKGSITIMRTRG